jgi:hypothetical protein
MMKERKSDHERNDGHYRGSKSNTTGMNLPAMGPPNNSKGKSGDGWKKQASSSHHPKGVYPKLVWALLVGFYLGVTVTIWVHTLQKADDHIQQEQSSSSGVIPPHTHTLDLHPLKSQAAVNCNCSETSCGGKAVVDVEAMPLPLPLPKNGGGAEGAQTKLDDHPQNQSPTPKKSNLKTPIRPPSSLPNAEEQAAVRRILQQTQHRSFLPLQAIVEEPPLSSLANRGNNYTYTKPLPLRTDSLLHTYTYFQNVHSCDDLPNGWPVDHQQELDKKYGPNVNNLGSIYEKRQDYAQEACPVDADPFLPWIHDFFPTADGQFIEFVANNKRRCRQDPSAFRKDIDNLEPQVALLQSVPVQRVSREELESLNIPDEWKIFAKGEQRYRLSSIPDADEDGKETRFICQFHTLNTHMDKILVGETLSVYPYNYEHANYQHRKGQRPNPMMTRPSDPNDINGIHNEQIWNAVLHFRCPVPSHLQQMVAEGTTVYAGIPSLYIDVVPIRTPPREGIRGYNSYHINGSTFKPVEEWGSMHILPPVDKSGRWANIPVCPPVVKPKKDLHSTVSTTRSGDQSGALKENYLTGCLWASAAFSVRGEERLDTSTSHRLLEWLTYHLEVAGFDKMIVYDNTAAFTNLTSLESVTALFPGRVERIPWKHRVCNNNRPTHPNAGERSSQYAAEASCRIRYGPATEWMIAFDTDEYLVPQGNYPSVKEWLQDSVRREVIGKTTHVLNFYQIRASLNHRFLERHYDNTQDCKPECKSCHCLIKRSNATFFESFCDPVPFPKPEWTGRAKKQLYRPSFVWNHFVHYAAVTRLISEKPNKPRVVGYPYERRVIELTEAFMLHTKTKAPRRTKFWKSQCDKGDTCPIGFAWPHYQEDNVTSSSEETNKDGYRYNCWESRKIHQVLAVRLREALEPLEKKWTPPKIAAPKLSSGINDAKVVTQFSDDSTEGTPKATIQDFVGGLVPAVIATKIQGNSTLLQLEQSLCLLKYAYNDRVNYDIVVFAATPITDKEANILKAAAAPAKLTIAMDNPGLDVMVAHLKADELAYLLNRCNVTDASHLTWKTRCLETSSAGTTNMPIQYTWQGKQHVANILTFSFRLSFSSHASFS